MSHSLNLAMCDTMKKCNLVREVMDVTYKISKLVKFSSKRNAIFNKWMEELSTDTPVFTIFFPTRGLFEILKSVLNTYSILQELWDFVLDGNVIPDVRARVIGVQARMDSFDYFFGVSVCKLVLSHG